MNLERTAIINETWKANEPTIADLLKIERDERNQLIIDLFTEMGEILIDWSESDEFNA